MKIHHKFRALLAIGVLFIAIVFLLFVFFATQTALDLWDRLQQLSDWLFYSYISLIAVFALFTLWLTVRLLMPTKFHKSKHKKLSEENLLKELETAEAKGVDTDAIRQEIQTLTERRDAGQVYVSFFGDVSTGKSSIIKALIPDASIETNVRGGSTQEIAEYTWQSPSGDQLILIDLPGRSEAAGSLDEIVHDEAVRSQVVIYVTDSDITRNQYEDIQSLLQYGKPVIVAVNKVDRYSKEEREALREHLQQKFSKQNIRLALISSGGEEEVIKIYYDGREEKVLRARNPEIKELADALQTEIDSQFETLNQLRDASVFVLVKQKLDQAKQAYRYEQGQNIVKNSTRKAVFGAMAAISPGTDLLIQGVIGSLMVKDICKLYEVPVRQLDIDKFLDFSQGQLKHSVPLILAVAGNGLKAFPGVGTLAGGLVHAVSYGIIFNALGNAVLKTLEQRGSLQPAPAALTFKELLGENLESNAKLFARLVLEREVKSKEK